jgi:hypothetical protein
LFGGCSLKPLFKPGVKTRFYMRKGFPNCFGASGSLKPDLVKVLFAILLI